MASDQKRTSGVHLYLPLKDGQPRLEIDREVLRTYENGDVHQVARRNLSRPVAELRSRSLPQGPHACSTYGDLFDVLTKMAASELETQEETKEAAILAEEAARRAVIESKRGAP